MDPIQCTLTFCHRPSRIHYLSVLYRILCLRSFSLPPFFVPCLLALANWIPLLSSLLQSTWDGTGREREKCCSHLQFQPIIRNKFVARKIYCMLTSSPFQTNRCISIIRDVNDKEQMLLCCDCRFWLWNKCMQFKIDSFFFYLFRCCLNQIMLISLTAVPEIPAHRYKYNGYAHAKAETTSFMIVRIRCAPPNSLHHSWPRMNWHFGENKFVCEIFAVHMQAFGF